MNFIIPLVIYPFDVMVSWGESDNKLKKTLDKFGLDTENVVWQFRSETSPGFCLMWPTNQTLIRLRHKPKSVFDFATIQHEIFHAVTLIMWKIGMDLKIKENDEAYAYLIEYLTIKIYNKILD